MSRRKALSWLVSQAAFTLAVDMMGAFMAGLRALRACVYEQPHRPTRDAGLGQVPLVWSRQGERSPYLKPVTQAYADQAHIALDSDRTIGSVSTQAIKRDPGRGEPLRCESMRPDGTHTVTAQA